MITNAINIFFAAEDEICAFMCLFYLFAKNNLQAFIHMDQPHYNSKVTKGNSGQTLQFLVYLEL